MEKNKRISKWIAVFLLALLFLNSCNEPDTPQLAYSSIKGSWRCTEVTRESSRSYSVDVYRLMSDTTQYRISNFHNLSFDGMYDVEVSLSKNVISINSLPFQIGSTETIIMSGSGTVNSTFTSMVIDCVLYEGKIHTPTKFTFSR